MDLIYQIIKKLKNCYLTDVQVMIICDMVYKICNDFNINNLQIYNTSEGLDIVLFDSNNFEQLYTTIYYDELELFNKPQPLDFILHFTDKLKARLS